MMKTDYNKLQKEKELSDGYAKREIDAIKRPGKYKHFLKDIDNQSCSKKKNKKRKKKKKVKEVDNLPYRKFLKSKYWYNVRKMVLSRDNKSCTLCGAKNKLEVHHLSYKNHLKEHEHLEDLITLCNTCHTLIHNT